MNTAKFKAAMVEAGETQRTLAAKANMSKNTLNSKINGKSPISIEEVVVFAQILNLSTERMYEIFLSTSSQ